MSGDVLNGLRNVDGAPIAPQTGEATHRPPQVQAASPQHGFADAIAQVPLVAISPYG
jgi:hypothetical protein